MLATMRQRLLPTSPALGPPYYEMLNFIDCGAFGAVTLAQHLMTETKVAVKTTDKTAFITSHRETNILKTLHHPNIIKLLQIINTTESCHLVLEYAPGGSLHDWIQQNIVMEEEARAMFQQILSAIEYCHHKMIAHRDLKPSNILLDNERNIKIADFGLAIAYHEGQRLRVCPGTLPYMAPELLLGQGYECPAMDVWALGVTLFEMVSNTLPFVSENNVKLKDIIRSGHYICPDSFSIGLKDLIKNMLTTDPKERPTVKQLMRDPWVNNGQDLPLTPFQEQILDHPNSETIQLMVAMGFEAENITTAIKENLYNYPMATYLILDGKKTQSTNTLAPGDLTQVSTSESFNSDPQHAPMASLTIKSSIGRASKPSSVTLAPQASQCDRVASIVSSIDRASKPSSVSLSPQALHCDPVASIVSSICSGHLESHLQPSAELAPQGDLVSAASTKCSTSSKTQPALPQNPMAASTQITTQSTLGQQSLKKTCVLEARQPEAALAQPTKRWSCRRAARRLERTEALRSKNTET
ncbi:hypothetical protein P7K49_007867 [Saguinus oedipus]|uniref:non-specific serine/threonine protein kinase n=1 Tax=Saguinus oedipus TaxID=9490 RepID=A0ABQ9VWV7_SAGOE|nr:hypothetical protein P7K49_007867 [Saguinus oedipus]